MIEDMGCPGSVPKDSTDVIDMVQVLRELTSMGQEEEDDDNSSDRCDRCRSNTLGKYTHVYQSQILLTPYVFGLEQMWMTEAPCPPKLRP